MRFRRQHVSVVLSVSGMLVVSLVLLRPVRLVVHPGRHIVGVSRDASHVMEWAWSDNQSESRDHRIPCDQRIRTVPSIHPYVRVMPSCTPDGPAPDTCISLPDTTNDVKLCLHNSSYLSRVLKSGTLYEGKFLKSMTSALSCEPGMVLLDVGANLGLYTVWAASMNHDVIAVEMLEENLLLLRHSLAKNNISGLTTLVNNALSNTHTIIQPVFIKSNVGETMLDNSLLTQKLHKVDSEKDRVQVKSICMDDLIPFVGSRPVFMKMDIEGSEHTALSCAHHLFNTANITVVQMEWKQRSQEEITQITNFMAGHGYTPSLRWDAVKEVDINVSTVRPGENVYFVRRLDTLGRSLIPMIYLITPTYRRPSQKADLTRLVYTFRHVPRLHWIVVEDSDNKTSIVSRLLETSGLSYTHLNVSSPNNGSRSTWMKGVMQRNAGLAWIRDNTEPDKDAVVYFADDDNTYDLRLFDQMRFTRRVSVWPVGLAGFRLFENIQVENGTVTGFYGVAYKDRKFAIDMAGFSVNTKYIHKYPGANFYYVKVHYQESDFISLLNVTLSDLEPVTQGFNEVLVWHTKSGNQRHNKNPPGPVLEV